jgi:hypothetical protein
MIMWLVQPKDWAQETNDPSKDYKLVLHKVLGDIHRACTFLQYEELVASLFFFLSFA